VDSDPINKNKNSEFIFKAKKIKAGGSWYAIQGKVLVKTFVKERFRYGDILLLEGKLYRPFSMQLSQRFDYRKYLENKNIYSLFSVSQQRYVKRLERSKNNPLVYYLIELRYRLKNIFDSNLSNLSASVLNAVILGERHHLSQPIKEILQNTGTVHIIAISGLHVGIVGFIALFILRLLRIPRRARYIGIMLFLILYCILTGAKTPVVRATLMATVLLAGFVLKREVNIYNSLSLAALIILIINPKQIFDVSFQLSFVSVISIISLSQTITAIYPAIFKRLKYLNALVTIFAISCAVWLGLLPLLAYYFKIISPVAIIANMIVVPFMTIVITSGFALLLISICLPFLASIFSAAAEGAVLILLTIISFFARLPFAYFKTTNFSATMVMTYYVLLILIFITLSNITKTKAMMKYKKIDK
jgi:competence protein ComEC